MAFPASQFRSARSRNSNSRCGGSGTRISRVSKDFMLNPVPSARPKLKPVGYQFTRSTCAFGLVPTHHAASPHVIEPSGGGHCVLNPPGHAPRQLQGMQSSAFLLASARSISKNRRMSHPPPPATLPKACIAVLVVANAGPSGRQPRPNPSLEARPNIKTPGPRSGAGYFPLCGPGVLLSVRLSSNVSPHKHALSLTNPTNCALASASVCRE